MGKFIKNILLLIIPFITYTILVLLIDPYNYINSSSLIDENLKKSIAEHIEPHLFKLISFDNNPKPNISLGDSRANGIFNCTKTSNFADISYGGGSINEMIQTFWYVADNFKLDTVIMGINFNLYNKYNTRFWVEETIERKSNFFKYFFNRYTFQSTILILKSVFSHKEISLGKPHLTKEEFWQYQLNVTAKKFYEKFSMPDNYYFELERISKYCRENNIKIIFWIPPTHMEFQDRIKDFNLIEQEKKFKEELKTLADLYDFDFPSELTYNRDNFSDPMHFNNEVREAICNEILTNKPHYARFYPRMLLP
jgi:hypothetical protein